MAKTKKAKEPKDARLQEHQDRCAQALNLANLRTRELDEFCKVVRDRVYKAWQDAGGCTSCNGYGQTLIWSTLDGPGWDEHGPCDACGGTGGRAGRSPCHWGRPSSRGSRVDNHGVAYAAEPEETKRLQKLATEAHDAYARVAMRAAHRGDTILVTQGRKLKPGTIAVFLARSQGEWGTSAGLLLPSGEVKWIPEKNIVVTELDDETHDDLMVVFQTNDEAFRKSKGLNIFPENYRRLFRKAI